MGNKLLFSLIRFSYIMLHKILIFIFILSAFSCETGKVRDTTIWIYKTKKDYSKNVPVRLSPDKTKIMAVPGNLNPRWPVLLIDSFYLGGSMGPNTGYVSLSIEDYNKLKIKPSNDSLYKLLIDKDPFIEFYQRNDDDGMFHNENGAWGIDTAFINDLIRKDQLEEYFVRLK